MKNNSWALHARTTHSLTLMAERLSVNAINAKVVRIRLRQTDNSRVRCANCDEIIHLKLGRIQWCCCIQDPFIPSSLHGTMSNICMYLGGCCDTTATCIHLLRCNYTFACSCDCHRDEWSKHVTDNDNYRSMIVVYHYGWMINTYNRWQ